MPQAIERERVSEDILWHGFGNIPSTIYPQHTFPTVLARRTHTTF